MIASQVIGVAARRRRNHGDQHAPLTRSFLAQQREVLSNATPDASLDHDVGVLEYIVARAPSPADVAVFDCAAARIREHARAERRELAAIHRALRRILTGDYGRCSVCARTIAADRMRRFADSAVCAPCESARRGVRARSDGPRDATGRRCGARRSRTTRVRRA